MKLDQGFLLRPHSDPGFVEVCDYVAGRSWKVSGPMLASIFLDQLDGSFVESAVRRNPNQWLPSKTSLNHWHERGWYPSDRQYLASRAVRFADDEDDDAAIRSAIMADLAMSEGLPPGVTRGDAPTDESTPPIRRSAEEVTQLLLTRRSGRSFVRRPVSLSVLTETLAEAFVDVRERRLVTDPDTPLSLVTSSFGSAWDVYIVAYDVEGLQSGAYKYDVVTRRLEARRTDHPDIRSYMCDALQGQRPPATAGFTVILVADFPRYQWRYRHDRALRVLYLESGIVSQYVVLAAWARGLATLVTPAQKDSAVSDLLGLDSTVLSTITTLTVGWSRGRRGSLLEGIDTEDCPE